MNNGQPRPEPSEGGTVVATGPRPYSGSGADGRCPPEGEVGPGTRVSGSLIGPTSQTPLPEHGLDSLHDFQASAWAKRFYWAAAPVRRVRFQRPDQTVAMRRPSWWILSRPRYTFHWKTQGGADGQIDISVWTFTQGAAPRPSSTAGASGSAPRSSKPMVRPAVLTKIDPPVLGKTDPPLNFEFTMDFLPGATSSS
jgi:hypothetical protein